MLAIGVVPINLCKCGLVGIRGRKWPRRLRYGDGETTQQGDLILDSVYPGSMRPAPRCMTENGIGISDPLVAM